MPNILYHLCIIPVHHLSFSKPPSFSGLNAVICQISIDEFKSVLGTGISTIPEFKKFIMQ